MSRMIPEWLAPTSLAEALELRARYADDAKVVAGGTFIGILLSQKIIMPAALLSLRNIHELTCIEKQSTAEQSNHREDSSGSLRIGAMTTHRAVERSDVVRAGWPIVAYTFSLV